MSAADSNRTGGQDSNSKDGSNHLPSSGSSDYGWDQSLEDDHVQLLISSGLELDPPTAALLADASLLHDTQDGRPGDRGHGKNAPLPPAAGRPAPRLASGLSGGRTDIIQHPDIKAWTDLVPEAVASLDTDKKDEAAAAASPLLRFRTAPRKPLSVSDLTAGAWCELQYEYTLTRLPGGRRTRTPAMRAGTKVHAKLEDEVHTTVRVEVVSREDMQGLRLWNLIQGLRTLRQTGLTRELEVWGVVAGDEVVSGVIDALSYECPDQQLAEALEASEALETTASQAEVPVERTRTSPRSRKRTRTAATPGPATPKKGGSTARITDYFSSPSRPDAEATRLAASTEPSPSPSPSPSTPPLGRRVYITDVKTRGSNSLPTGAAVQPTKIQLLLYHRFLSDMAADRLDWQLYFARYALDPDVPFSDAFLAQIGGLHDEIFCDDNMDQSDGDYVDEDDGNGKRDATRDRTEQSTSFSSLSSFSSSASFATAMSTTTPGPILYGTLRSLAGLVRREVAETFPQGAASVGRLVTAEYRLRPTRRRRWKGEEEEEEGNDEHEKQDKQDKKDTEADSDDDGRRIGTNVMVADEAVLDRYLAHYLEWWRGERTARGVDIEEASLKCGYCEFAGDCHWRQRLDEERVQRVRERLAGK